MDRRIPVIDISPIRGRDTAAAARLASRIDLACRDLGFLVIEGHGVDPAMTRALHDRARMFFALPPAEKRKVAIGTVSEINGYAGNERQNLGRTLVEDDRGEAAGDAPLPDLRETYQIGPFGYPDEPYFTTPPGSRYFSPNAWPERVPELRPVMEGYFRALEKLSNELLEAFALALGLPRNWFRDKVDRSITSVLINHYAGLVTPPPAGQLRASPHTDFGAVTILHHGENAHGLQVLDHDGRWRDVTAPYDCFIVNIGDLMARWTNDAWRSTLHRVVVPDDPAVSAVPRQTITTFVRPNFDASIECIDTCAGPDNPPRYPPISSGAHYDMKIALLRGQNTA